MTEEDPLKDKEEYEFPNQHMEKLREYEVGSPYYNIIQGSVYDKMRYQLEGFEPSDAVEINKLLQNGQVDEAEARLEELTEEDLE